MVGRIRWRALWIARENKLMYTYGEHVLLALLENMTPEVAKIIEGQGIDPTVLRVDVGKLVSQLVPTRVTSDEVGEDVELENAAWDLASGDYAPEHLLLAITSPLMYGPKIGRIPEAGSFLISRGLTPDTIRAGLPAEPPKRQVSGPLPHKRQLVIDWRDAGREAFNRLWVELRNDGDWAMLGHLYEVCAASEMLERRAIGPDADTASVARNLVMAAHWLRKAGEHERARLIAQRAIHELQQIHTDGTPNPKTLAAPIDVAFAFEMMGDAAICLDAEMARAYWLRAIEEFHYIDRVTQSAEWNEPWFHGWYLSQVHLDFLSGDPRDFGDDGASRVADKKAQWLGA